MGGLSPDWVGTLRGDVPAGAFLIFGQRNLEKPARRGLEWEYDRVVYRRRNEIERLFRRLKGYRRVFSRFDKLDVLFSGFVVMALIFEALRVSVNTPAPGFSPVDQAVSTAWPGCRVAAVRKTVATVSVHPRSQHPVEAGC